MEVKSTIHACCETCKPHVLSLKNDCRVAKMNPIVLLFRSWSFSTMRISSWRHAATCRVAICCTAVAEEARIEVSSLRVVTEAS